MMIRLIVIELGRFMRSQGKSRITIIIAPERPMRRLPVLPGMQKAMRKESSSLPHRFASSRAKLLYA
jgi:hypothetical protein